MRDMQLPVTAHAVNLALSNNSFKFYRLPYNKGIALEASGRDKMVSLADCLEGHSLSPMSDRVPRDLFIFYGFGACHAE